MKILLTGGAGFIGSNILKSLNENGISDIIIIDNIGESQKWLNIKDKKFTRYINKNDVFKSDILSSPVDYIIHLGACSVTTESNFDYLYKNNYLFSIEIANYAMKFNIPFIYASSASTYGNGEQGFDDRILNLKPLNRYAFSKHLFDKWALTNLKTDFIGLKFFNVFGPNEYHKGSMKSVIYKFYYEVKENKFINLYKSHNSKVKDGDQSRDYVYVRDISKFIMYLIKSNKFPNDIVNFGLGTAYSYNYIAHYIFKYFNMDTNIKYIDMPNNLIGKYQYYTKANLDKFKVFFPDFTFSPFLNSISDYYDNFLSKEDNYL